VQRGLRLKTSKSAWPVFTPRERQVFDLVTAGFLNMQIGFELGVAEGTIKVHRARVMEKVRAGSVVPYQNLIRANSLVVSTSWR
jgi:FixJ family two-component response regulator